jgi:BirA family biotin operon repressor/biotin-[acetyl-CoA-carboxylase] ligase
LRGHLAGLHWPNDVYIGPRKLAGILVEALADGRHIVGIGLNVNNSLREAPAELHHIATTLRDLAEECSPHAPREVSEGGIEATYADGRRSVPAVGAASEASTAGASALALSRDRVLRSLLVQLERAWDALAQAPESLAERFNALCVQQGQAVTLKNGQETVCGVCEGIDADGGLILATPSGRKKFYAGVVAR